VTDKEIMAWTPQDCSEECTAASVHIAEVERERDQWKQEFELYRRAWIRELGGTLINKTHEIDALVLTSRQFKGDTKRAVLATCVRDLKATCTRSDVVDLYKSWEEETTCRACEQRVCDDPTHGGYCR
jgi:hypothetical protein